MKIRISPLTPLMFAAVGLTGNIKLYLLAYGVMAVHELSHLAAALLIGLKANKITFSPFGVHLTLDCKIINSISDEIILYSVGPMLNAVFALISAFCGFNDLYRLNIVLFVMNILPVVPLDGGMILLRLLSYRLGRKRTQQLLSGFSMVAGIAVLCIACYSVYLGYINISLFIMAVLFIGNVLTSREMYDTDFINAISCRKKHSNKTNIVIIDKNHGPSEAIKMFSPSYTTIAFELDDKGGIAHILTEEDMLDFN